MLNQKGTKMSNGASNFCFTRDKMFSLYKRRTGTAALAVTKT